MKVALIFFFFFIGSVSSSKILFLLPILFRSESHVFEPLINGLAAKGHDLTVVTSIPSRTPLPSNIRQISPVSVDSLIDAFGNIFEVRKMGRWEFLITYDVNPMLDLQNKTYADLTFRQVIDQQYDLIIVSGMLNEAMLGAVFKIGAPFILFSTMPAHGSVTAVGTGNYLPTSFVPPPCWEFTQHMTFIQRVTNYIISFFTDTYATVHCPRCEAIYREALGQDIPGLDQIFKNVSLILMNSHFSLNYPRPNLPDNIEVGGIHCRPAKPLDKDLESFLSGGDHGFILFSLGSIIKGSDMSEEQRKVFVNVFSRLKQRVLWKWDTDTMEDLPPNVKLAKWIPQQDILGHPKISFHDPRWVAPPAKPLEKNLESFLSGGNHGFILFSLGSIVKGSDMSEEQRKVFVNVFSRLKQRVLWKWDIDTMEDLPPNVKLAKWIPQQDLLGHPKIRVFMTHGGLLSTQEASYHGVPLLGFPVFADQDSNMMLSESHGFALTIEILNITENELELKLKRLLEEPIFQERAKTLSKIVRDQLETPLERAIYWSEYVIRHKGAHHLRSAARNLNFFQVHSYDVILFLLTLLTLTLFLVILTLQCIVRQICRVTKSKTPTPDFRKKWN